MKTLPPNRITATGFVELDASLIWDGGLGEVVTSAWLLNLVEYRSGGLKRREEERRSKERNDDDLVRVVVQGFFFLRGVQC